MKRFKCNKLTRALSISLLSLSVLYGQAAFADPGLVGECMEDRAVAGGLSHLTCRANDINIANATNIEVTHIDGIPVPAPTDTCVSGKDVTFSADFNVVSTASARYDIGLYFNNEGGADAREGDPDACTSYTLSSGTDTLFAFDLDGLPDTCLDAEQDAEIVKSVTLTTKCIDTDDDGQLNLPNCVSWRQPGANELCESALDAFPGAPSKCNCDDDFNVPIFIQPDPPTITKSVSPLTGTEPGQAFTYTVKIEPGLSTGNSVFVNKIVDELSSSTDFVSATFVLNDKDGPNDIGTTSAPYTLLSSGLENACEGIALPYEITPTSLGLTCTYKIRIDDRVINAPEKFENYIRATIVDENGDAVGTNDCTVPSTPAVPNPNCSNEIVVTLTDLPPAITVTKTANPTEVMEPGAYVEFTIEVENDSAAFDSPLTLTVLNDTDFGDLLAEECSAQPTSIAFEGTYTCVFTKFIAGDAGDQHSNTVSATALDDENSEATGNDSAMVDIRDVPSMITLVKTANPTTVLETGDDPDNYSDVSYNFEFGVNVAGVDKVTFSSLTDVPFGTLTGDCLVDTKNGSPITETALNGFMLLPGETASCDITKSLQGNTGDTHLNTATIRGVDEDGQDVDASDDALVTFTPRAPQTDMAFATSLLVVIELNNAGFEDVTFTDLTVKGLNVVDGTGNGDFIFRNAVGGTHAGVSYSACVIGTVLGYNGSGTDVYSCAFTIELKPGIENTNSITFLGIGVNGVAAIVEDDEGTQVINGVTVEVNTVE